MKFKHIQTHVNTNTTAGSAAQKIGGVSVAQLQSALLGDKKILKKLGAMHREGQMAKLLMPAIIETMQTKIQTEADWNKFLGQYVQDGSKADLDINTAKNQASLANAKYVHGRKEQDEQFRAAWEMEKGRHKFAIDYNRAKFFANILVQKVNGVTQVNSEGNKVELLQLDTDRKYEEDSAQHLLKYGNESDLSLIEKKNYNKESSSPGLWRRFTNFVGI